MLFGYRNVMRAVRDDRWKLIRYPQVDKTQLFDLNADPFEVTNLADKPEHAATLATMNSLLAAQAKNLGDTAPLKVDSPMPSDWAPPAVTKPRKKAKASQ